MKPLYNIFSKKKTKVIKKPEKIIIDYREKNSLLISVLIKKGFEIEFRELKVADYIINNIAIERKTVSDFINSMINKRLVNQIEELQQYEDKLLVIEGVDEQELYPENNGVNPDAIRGFLLSIALKYKIPMILTKNHEDTAKFFSILSRKKQKEPQLNVKKKALNNKEQAQFIIEGFPGIGPKTAIKLLKEFKTIKNIINASEKELKKVIGKKAEVMKRIIEKE